MQDGVLLVDKPAGDHLARRRRRRAAQAAAQDEGRARRHARPVRDRAAARADRPGDPRAALPDGAAQALRDGRAAGLDVDHGRPRRRDRARARTPAEPLDAARPGDLRQRPPAYSAVKVGGRRAYALARAGRGGRARRARGRRVRASSSSGATGSGPAFAIECGSGTYVRSLIADLGDAYCLELRRTADRAVRRRRRRRASCRSPTRSASCPAVELAGDDARRAARHGVAVRRRRRAGRGGRRACGCSTPTGLIALAEPRGDGTLKPVVGFRG